MVQLSEFDNDHIETIRGRLKRSFSVQKKTPSWLIASKTINDELYELLLLLSSLCGDSNWVAITRKELAGLLGYTQQLTDTILDNLHGIGLVFSFDYKGSNIIIMNEQSYETGNILGAKWRPEPDIILDALKEYKLEKDLDKPKPQIDIVDIERQRHERSTKPII